MKIDITNSTTSPKKKRENWGKFQRRNKVIPVESQSEDSESEATEQLDEPRDDPDRTKGLDRRADPGNKTETQLENQDSIKRHHVIYP